MFNIVIVFKHSARRRDQNVSEIAKQVTCTCVYTMVVM